MVEATLKLPLAINTAGPGEKVRKTSTIAASKNVLFCELNDGAVILVMKSGVYYGLDAVGTRIWSLIQEPRSVTQILSTLCQEYDVDEERCELDIRALLQNMSELGLIEICDENA